MDGSGIVTPLDRHRALPRRRPLRQRARREHSVAMRHLENLLAKARNDLGHLVAATEAVQARALLAQRAPEERGEHLAAVVQDLGRLRRNLFDEILALRAVEAGRTATEPVDLRALASWSFALLEPLLLLRGQSIHFRPPEGGVDVAGDETILRPLLRTLVQEAAELSLPRAIIEVAIDIDDGDVFVSVLGRHPARVPRTVVTLSDFLQELTRLARGSVEAVWDDGEGPTLVLRLPLGQSDPTA